MDSANYVGRSDILAWINATLHLNLSKVEEASSGAVQCQLIDAVHPGVVPMHKVNFNAKLEHEMVMNYKVLRDVFIKLKITKHIDANKLIKGRLLDNLDFMRWMKRYCDSINGGLLNNYNPTERRKVCKGGKEASKKCSSSQDSITIAAYKQQIKELKLLVNSLFEMAFHFSEMRVEETVKEVLKAYDNAAIVGETQEMISKSMDRECDYLMSDHMSEDNFFQILKRVPVKSLLQCRCVCKWWKEIIDSSSFLQEHLTAQKPCFIAHSVEPEFMVLDPRTLPKFETMASPVEGADGKFLLVGTLHGVVCLYDEVSGLLLWNPSLRKLTRLPLPATVGFNWLDRPAYSTLSAFWIDPSSKDFKIIAFNLGPNVENGVNGVVYSSIQQNWRALPLDEVRKYCCYHEGPPVLIEGVAHWTALALSHHIDEDNKKELCWDMVILCFHHVQERFYIIEAPYKYNNNNNGEFTDPPTPFSLRGTLSIVYWTAVKYPRRCEVYSRQEGRWVKMLSFMLLHQMEHVFWAEDMEERYRALCETDGAFVFNDTKDGCFVLKSGLGKATVNVAYDFVESLLFP